MYKHGISDNNHAASQNQKGIFTLLKATSNVIYSASPDWKVMTGFCGRKFFSDVKGHNSNWIDKYIYPEDKKSMCNAIQNSITEKKIFEHEYRVLRADGSICWMFSCAVPIFDESGNIKKWLGVAKDITERKKIDEALRRSEERFRSVLENSLDGINLLNIKTGKYDYINPAQAEITGFTLEDLENLNLKERVARVHPLDLSENPQISGMFTKGKSAEAEFRWRTKSGEYRWLSTRSKPVLNGNGEPIYTVTICRDITKNKQAEIEMNRQNNILKAINNIYEKSFICSTYQELGIECLKIISSIIGNKAGLIGIIGNDGLLYNITFNLGSEIPAVLQDKYKHINKMEIIELYRDLLKNARIISANDFYDYSFGFDDYYSNSIGAPVRRFRLHSFFSIPYIQEGKILGIVNAVNKDGGFSSENRKLLEAVTPSILEVLIRKKAEQELEESQKHTLSLVKQLEKADEYKNRFISILSHELRNPLTAIFAGIHLIDMTQDIDEITRMKGVIKRQINKLFNLVDDLLELTRINQNKISLQKRNINLNKIVKNTAEDVILKYEEKGVGLEVKTQIEPVYLNADPLRISQIIENILSNALEFTKENGMVWLTLETEKNYAVLSIKDNGIGIDPEILPHLFTPFTQADNALNRENSGLGLGLSIVKGIVDLHGGTVSAYSEGLGKGATFTVRLPTTP